MNKNLVIFAGIVLAAVAGYFIRGMGNNDIAYDYADCVRDCRNEHNSNLASIRQTYDRCLDNAIEELRETLKNCPCGNPLKPPCIICRDRAFDAFGEKIAPCRAARDSAITLENERYRKCRTICNNMISFNEN